MSYSFIYGKDRQERAVRMYKKQPPKGMDPPEAEVKRFRALGITARFERGAYVENVADVDRDYIVVRSQKSSDRYKKYYFIRLLDKEAIRNRSRGGYLGECTCKDWKRMCKHKLAVMYTVRGYIYGLRF